MVSLIVKRVECVVHCKIKKMFVILWLVLFVPTIYSNEILNLFSSSLEAFDVIKRTISPVEFIDQSVNEDSRLTTVMRRKY